MSDNQPKTTCRFKIGIKGVHWRSLPVYSISINNVPKIIGEHDLPTGEVEWVEFEDSLDPTEMHELEIRLEHKYQHDTALDSKGNIAKDMFIKVESVTLDDFDLGEYINQGVFTPDDTPANSESGQLTLHRAGSYRLKFMLVGE